MLIGLASASALASPSSAVLTAEPVRCVALHRGQDCHFDARLQWHADAPGHYCLFRGGHAAPLQCWPQASRGELRIPMRSTDTVAFELRRRGDAEVLARAEIEIAWVYAAPRRPKSSWRLF